jgi:acetyl-CoA acetyltransferase
MKFLQSRSISIVGYAETKLERKSGKTVLQLAGEALHELLRRTGIDRESIDGFVLTMSQSEAGNPMWSNVVAEALGLSPSWMQVTDLGGATAVGNVARAAAAIHAGACQAVLCLCADAPSTSNVSRQSGYRPEFYDPMGYSGPPVVFGLLSSAYRARYGLPEKALAKLAVTQRKGALLNPNACETLRLPLTEEQYLNSRMVSDPIRLLDCVMPCDGANALLVTSSSMARRFGATRVVHPIAYREVSNFDPLQRVDDITVSGFSISGPQALDDAGMKAADIRMLQAYDDFLIAVMLQLEQIGFCTAGQSGDFVLGHDIGYAGELPVNTGGGMISCGQPGLAGGGLVLTEAVRQLFGEGGARQVPNPSNAMVTGIGAMQYARNWGTSSVLILEAG